MTNVNEVEITFTKPKGGIIGFASCVIDNKWYLGNIAVYSCLEGEDYKVVYPTRKLKNGQNINTVHPINKLAEQSIKKAILAKLQCLMK